MITKPNPPLSQEQIAKATDWVLVISENPDIAQNAEFAHWLSQDDSNRIAFNEVAITFGIAASLPKSVEKDKKPTFSGLALKAYFALAASIALCCILLLSQAPAVNSPQRAEFATAIGEISSFILADGSSLVLDTNSRADASITGTVRHVQLKQGRLFVDVAHDTSRQFSVAIDDTFAFTALGTAYSVEKKERTWTLEVYEGTVGITSTLVTYSPVQAGWGLRYENRRIHRYPLPDTLIKTKPNWQQNRIVFDGTSLRDAVTQFNRYMTKPLTIKDPELASLSLSGTFDLRDSQAFMESISQLMGAKIHDKPERFEIEATRTPEN